MDTGRPATAATDSPSAPGTSAHNTASGPMTVGADRIRAGVPMKSAVRALQQILRDGLDPEADPARSSVPVENGHLLLMPSGSARYAGVKIASVAPGNPARGLPRIQGNYLLMDAATLTPLAFLDGVALTSIRTAAVSAAAADLLAVPGSERLVLFGYGPQAHSHLEALRTVRPVSHVTVVARHQERVRDFVAQYGSSGPAMRVCTPGAEADRAVAAADIVACCTSSGDPLFDGASLQTHATVVAVGSHEPTARETDDTTVRRSTVVVESRASALREAGDITLPVASGALDPAALTGLAELARGEADFDSSRPRFFKSVGMAWEDLVLAGAAYEAAAPA